ncbi:P-loop NTPase [Arthrobacter sp. H5]|uniref:AAA family ATPase n=1 Tax=Arthrobacter sp. H5 TaxID=1267973 RepID=UPI0004B0AC9D|nr:P-loop NTPase [Arthrobacter sp. H5]
MSIPVVTVGQSAGDCVTGLEKLRGPVTVVRRCAELTELIAACQTGIARAAIVAVEAGELTASLLDRLRGAEVALVVLADSDEATARLDSLGVRHAPGNVDPEVLTELVSAAVDDLAMPGSAPAQVQGSASFADTADALNPAQATPEPDPSLAGEGRVIAVWGPAGSPGRTTVAVNIAAELAASGSSVLLIDADTYGASIAASLGLLDESAGVAQACRFADQGSLDLGTLQRITTDVVIEGTRLRVLTGITRPDRWAEVRPAALARVLELARTVADTTIVDCGFCLEADEELSFDTVAPRRNGATLRSLELADSVIAVGSADSVGVPRMVRGLGDLAAAVPSAEPRVVFNKVRAGSVGRSPERQLQEAWDRFGPGVEIDAFLPADVDAADAALLAGSALVESSPSSSLRQAIAALVDVPVEQRRRGVVGGGHNEVKFSRNGVRLSR